MKTNADISLDNRTVTPARVEALRAATPGCEHRLHLNTAGAGLVPRRVLNAMTGHLIREAVEGPIEAAAAVQTLLDDARILATTLISFTVDGVAASQVRQRLAVQQINIGANGVPYTPLDMRARQLTEIARMSVSYLTTEDEIERAVAAVRTVAQR